MTHTPTLDPDRFQQLRTFLIVEATAQAADVRRRTLVGSRRRRLVVGAVAVIALSGVLAVSTLRPGGTDRALAITTEGEWTTVRLSDIDADAQAVVDELVAAGINARIASRDQDPTTAPGDGVTTEIVTNLSHELNYGLSIVFPVGSDPNVETRSDAAEDGLFAIRSGSDALVLVHPRE
jgi:hypothetical protein